MIRFLHVLAITGLIASAGYAYSIKYDTLFYAEEIARLKARLGKERDAIAIAKAEWALLTRPDRLQRIVDQHLDMQALGVNQLARLSDLTVRPQKGDEIGRKLEALGLEPAAAPPREKRPGEARLPTTTGSLPKGPVKAPQ